ncbi:MAG: hypothetical protein KF760_24290 [Candidatus Eremiobacteraeota bacterium]|nr:hypothetical protein [Candidatus Eremiobacteraeota bacterium]MCW5867499.1 hypothetical protein [Candidatus Eremiobacteraeota bacterium]
MSAVYASPAQYRCSCGRAFMNGISLERHQWVTKHPAADSKNHVMLPDQQARATQAAMAQAMRVLKEKQAAQNQFDQKRRQRRRLRRQIQGMANEAYAKVCSLGRTLLMAGRVAAVLGVIGATVAAGMKIGTFFPA